MDYLFAAMGTAALGAFLDRDTLIALDYDGTLAPIVARPEHARMRDETRQLLSRLARRRPVVVLTGRSRADALRLLAGTSVLEVIGSHGVETQSAGGTRFQRRVAEWRDILLQRLRQLRGVKIEDKRYSLAIHYRQSADPVIVEDVIGRVTDDLSGARIMDGNMAVELVPIDAPDKGMALLGACYRLGQQKVVYVGDDDTDEAAFAVGRPGQVFGIRIGRPPQSLARCHVHDQTEIDALLRALIDPHSLTSTPRLTTG